MALGALVACAVLVYRNWATRAAWPLLCLNVLVLAMAAGRGTIGAFFTCVVVPMFLVSARWASVRGRSAIVYRYALLVLVGLAIFAVVFPRVAARSGVETSTGQQAGLVNTSGRSQAWAYFLERTSESPWFGNGVGTVTVMVRADQTVNQGFVAAHNEYIQTYTEGGWFGLGLFLVLVLAMFARDFTKVVDPKLRMPLGFLLLGVGVYSITDNSQYVLFSLPFAIAYAAFMVPGHCERVVPPARARIRRRSRARSRLPMDAVMPERPGPAEPARPPAPVAA
jgi:O-antigen ligase